jgi:isocitrate/isopropylmalate dehydrogenase
MTTAKSKTSGNAVNSRTVYGKSDAGSIIEYARKVASSKKRSLEIAQKANIITKSGQLTAHYKK